MASSQPEHMDTSEGSPFKCEYCAGKAAVQYQACTYCGSAVKQLGNNIIANLDNSTMLLEAWSIQQPFMPPVESHMPALSEAAARQATVAPRPPSSIQSASQLEQEAKSLTEGQVQVVLLAFMEVKDTKLSSRHIMIALKKKSFSDLYTHCCFPKAVKFVTCYVKMKIKVSHCHI